MLEKLKNMTKKQKIISAIVAGVILIAIIVVVALLVGGKKAEPDGVSDVLLPELEEPIEKEEPLDVVASLSDRKKSLEDAKSVNDKAYMWLSIPGTDIHYPVIYDSENNNMYWERRNLEGEEVASSFEEVVQSVVYASYKTIFDADASKNIVLYGHNWNNVDSPFIIGKDPAYTMFAQLPSFTDIDFARKYQYIYTNTEDTEEVWQIFSVMYTESRWPDEIGVQYIEENPDSAQQATLIQEMKDRSIFDYDISVNPDDKILTLSTCTRYYMSAGDAQRYVVVAKRLNSGDKKDNPCEVTVNEDVKSPAF